MSTVARAVRDNQKMAYSLNPAIEAASSASLTGSCSLTLVWSSSTGGVRMAPNRPARPVSTSHLSTAASPASPDIGGSVGELHELYDQLGAGASAIRDFQLAGIPLALQTMRYTGAQSEARATATGRPVDRTGRNPDLAAWVRWQRILSRPGGPTYELILDEFAVRRMASLAPAMRVKSRYPHDILAPVPERHS